MWSTTRQRAALSYLAVLCALHVVPGSAVAKAAAGDKNQKTADSFWRTFRSAVVARDAAAIAGMAEFPFVVRWGNADPNDPRVAFRRDQFDTILDHLLALPGPGVEGKTMSQAIAENEQFGDRDARAGSFMVEDFQFALVKGSWRWVAAFTDDPFFYKFNESQTVAVRRGDPVRSLALDVTAQVAHLKRPLIVKHLRATAEVAYLEAREPGKDGRLVRAFLHREKDDPQGHMVWAVKDWSFQSIPCGSDDWTSRMKKLIASGVPAGLFATRATGADERQSRAR